MERKPVYPGPRSPAPIPEHPPSTAAPQRPRLTIQEPYGQTPQGTTVPVRDNSAWPDPSPAGPGTYAPPPSYASARTPYASDWSNGLFDCFDPCDLCITACICPCVVFGKTQTRLADPSLSTYSPINRECFYWYGLSLFSLQGIYQCLGRRDIRSRFNLKGDDIGDCLLSNCCICCALIQEEKEVELKMRRVDTQGYVRPPGMRMYQGV